MQIFLIGFMGSGKTHTAKRLAQLLDQPFLDLDQYTEQKGGQTIAKLFEFGGPQQFRKIEQQNLREVINKYPDHIIATGGGTPIYFDNLEVMKAEGLVVYLDVDPMIIYNRIKDTGDQRPLLKTLQGTALKAYITDLLTDRKAYYQKAHVAVEIKQSNMDAAQVIADYYRKITGSWDRSAF